ncbi:PREDICTED: uncharacterized protein LOC104804510 [Tarenaya hassleriana]|uniref:uncharacterized protein LOC104804510 n=1 Tax=Tarenaya hassleriana TaxID=28532 RepID=UPI00053C7239|nr:PREDICTED: uncharacterized protein LOC104804510 [Tarenaya hassleriana]
MTLIVAPNLFTTISASSISQTITPSRRSLLQLENVSQTLFEDDRTVRVDPLDNLKKYRGGYDISNKHYWSSLVFTGIYGYAIGVAWLLCGAMYGSFLLASRLFFRRANDEKPKRVTPPCIGQCYQLQPLLLSIFLTVSALTASGVFFGGNARFHSKAKRVVEIIIDTADDASETIYNTTGAITRLSSNTGISSSLDNRIGNDQASVFLASTSQRLDDEAANIQRQARKNRRIIDKALRIVYAVTTVIVSLSVIALVSLLVCGVLRFKRGLNMLIILTWLLIALCWSFFGVYFFLEKFSGDTCAAFSSFQKNPQNNSLSSILPCDELLSAKPILSDVSSGIYNLVTEVNANISTLKATTLPGLAFVCNPFSGPPDFQYQPENCPTDTIKIGDIPQILRVFTCSDGTNTTCKDGEFISYEDFRRVEAYTSSVQEILNAYPGMQNLVECESVKDAFTEILANHCKPLKRYARMAWISVLCMSILMIPLILLWTFKARHESEFHTSDAASVRPHHVGNSDPESSEDAAIGDRDSSI